MPDRLYFTDSDEANQLIAEDPLALLIGFALDQQVTVQKAFSGPLAIRERVGTLDAARLAASDLESVFRERPAVHRFPGSMAARIQQLARIVVDEYDGHADRLWTGADSGRELMRRLQALPGFGKQKAQIFTALLGKQLDVRPEGWETAAGDYAEPGAHRSVADVVDASSLEKVRAFKKEKKRASAS
jgi:uncharacterized HhH-GPD family protein